MEAFLATPSFVDATFISVWNKTHRGVSSLVYAGSKIKILSTVIMSRTSCSYLINKLQCNVPKNSCTCVCLGALQIGEWASGVSETQLPSALELVGCSWGQGRSSRTNCLCLEQLCLFITLSGTNIIFKHAMMYKI